MLERTAFLAVATLAFGNGGCNGCGDETQESDADVIDELDGSIPDGPALDATPDVAIPDASQPDATPDAAPPDVIADTSAPTWPMGTLSHETGSSWTVVQLSWSGAVDDVGIALYRLYQDDSLIFEGSDDALELTELASGATYSFHVEAGDSVGNWSTDGPSTTFTAVPPDPIYEAPPVESATTIADTTEFLYSGDNPVQYGVEPGAIRAQTACVLRGAVFDSSGAAVPGVTVAIVDHPELGTTATREDGAYDIVVNGGGLVTVHYEKENYLPVERQLDVPWNDYMAVSDVYMAIYAENSTLVTTDAALAQTAEGSVVTDEDGTRQAVVVLPATTVAELTLADGSSVPLSELTIRASEYTVGEAGPAAMPGELPSESAYTYAIELSVDEAILAGATSVEFSQPVYFYVDNFLGFPVGTEVPVGTYQANAWYPEENGITVEILDVDSGLAMLDTDGDGAAESLETYESLGISDEERSALGERYTAGQSLWRAALTHFSPIDLNFPPSYPEGALPPAVPGIELGVGDGACLVPHASTVEAENQTLRETIHIAGTPHDLVYQSDRVGGRLPALDIPLGDSIPDAVQRIDLEVRVGGAVYRESYPPIAGQDVPFSWERIDPYERTIPGAQAATIRVGYVYNLFYDLAARFGRPGLGMPTTVPAREKGTLWKEQRLVIPGGIDLRAQGFGGLGGWRFSVHHQYDPVGRVLYLGDGGERSAQSGVPARTIRTILGTGDYCWDIPCDDGVLASQARIDYPSRVAVAPDGQVYVLAEHGIYRILADGILEAAYGIGGAIDDDIDAYEAGIFYASDIAFAPDGSLLVAVPEEYRVRRIKDGIITTVAGNGSGGFTGDGGPATEATIGYSLWIDVGRDGSIYISDAENQRIRRVGPDGRIDTLVGSGEVCACCSLCVDGQRALDAPIGYPMTLALAPDGSLYFVALYWGHGIYRLGVDGIVHRVAGDGTSWEDGVLITDAAIDYPGVSDLAFAKDGSWYYTQVDSVTGRHVIRRVGPDGYVRTIAGGTEGSAGDGGPANDARFNFDWAGGLAFSPDERLYVADASNHRLRVIEPTLPGIRDEDFIIPSADGQELYQFDKYGRHEHTLHALTGGALWSFAYDADGRLSTLTDGDGNVTSVERDGDGAPVAVVGPFGHTTTLTTHPTGELASIVDPLGNETLLTYGDGGLLSELQDPNGNVSRYYYDDLGRLTQDEDPEGGTLTLVRETTPTTQSLGLTTKMGRSTTFLSERLATGALKRTVTTPSGLASSQETSVSEDRRDRAVNGTIHEVRPSPDPRWGMQAPFAGIVTDQTVQNTRSVTHTRTAVLEMAGVPTSLTTLADTYSRNGKVYSTTFDRASSTYTHLTPLARTSVVTVDGQGRTIKEELPGITAKEWHYDAMGRVTGISQGDREWQKAYDAFGNMTSSQDPLGAVTSHEYDALGRRTRTILSSGEEALFVYDPLGRLTGLSPPGRPEHAFAYTATGLLKEYSPPAASGSAPTTLSYDLDRALSQVAHDDLLLERSYDAAGRLTKVSSEADEWTLSYDDETGLMVASTAPEAGSTFTYDGDLMTELETSGAITGSTHWDYDSDFRVTRETIDGSSIDREYDDDGLLLEVGDLVIERDAETGWAVGAALLAITDETQYDDYGAVTSYTAWFDADELYSATYERDLLARVSSSIETVLGEVHTYSYAYDSLGRLTDAEVDGLLSEHYEYDANGNLIDASTVVDDQDRLLATALATYSYAKDGQLATKAAGIGVTAYTYDVFGNLRNVTLPDATQIDYVTDGRHLRIGKKVNGTLVGAFLYDAERRLVAELDGDGVLISRFVYGAKPSAAPEYQLKGGRIYRLVSDARGSVRLVVDAESGAVEEELHYDAFGQVELDTNPGFQPFGFAGGLYDADTGLVRFGVRDYDAETGRFTAKDPLGFATGAMNLYVYADGDPVNQRDPQGFLTLDDLTLPTFEDFSPSNVSGGIGPPMPGMGGGWGGTMPGSWGGQEGSSSGLGGSTNADIDYLIYLLQLEGQTNEQSELFRLIQNLIDSMDETNKSCIQSLRA